VTKVIRMLAQIGPGVDAFSTDAFPAMLLAILVGGAARYGASLPQGGASFQAESVRTGSGPAGPENLASRTLYALALAVLVASFVGFGIETFYPAPESPEKAALSQDVPPPLPPIDEYTPPGEEPGLPGPNPGGKSPIESYEQELATHNQAASVVAIAVALLVLVADLISGALAEWESSAAGWCSAGYSRRSTA
jgi:hypothetical protein